MSIGIYAHIPFCARRCDYCDFFVVVGGGSEEAFFEWLGRDLALAVSSLGVDRPSADTLYLGGGTPSSVDPARIAGFIARTAQRVSLEPGAEVTLEANPESVTADRARSWLGAGVNRLSLGVQSFNDAVLPRRGRLYDASRACAAARAARGGGFDNLGIDLIAGLPGETVGSFRDGLETLIDLAPDHVSVYLLETADALKQTPLSRAVQENREHLPDEEDTVTMYGDAVERLSAAGYDHYEISNFARPARASRHNLKYWTSDTWLGVGPSAHAHVGGRRFSRPADMGAWIEQVRGGSPPPPSDDYTLEDPGARAREALVLALRLVEGVDLRGFARRWGMDPSASLGRAIDGLERDGLVVKRANRLSLTFRGILFSNEVFTRLT